MNADKAIGAIVVSGLAVLCCAGPALIATVGAAALSASALAGGAAAVASAVALVGLGALWSDVGIDQTSRPRPTVARPKASRERRNQNRHPGRSARLPSSAHS